MSVSFPTYHGEIRCFPQPIPEQDDVVIRSCPDAPADYALGRDHAPDQIRYPAYASALNVAKRWAIRQHLDVWFHDHGREFILLSRHRRDDAGRSHIL